MPSKRNPRPLFEFKGLDGPTLDETQPPQRLKKPTATVATQASLATPAWLADTPTPSISPFDIEQVFDALLIAGWRRGVTALMTLLKALSFAREDGGTFTSKDVSAAMLHLVADGRVRQLAGEGYVLVPSDAADKRLGQLLLRPEVPQWWRTWLWVTEGGYGRLEGFALPGYRYVRPRHPDEAVALLRLVWMAQLDTKTYAALVEGPLREVSTVGAVLGAMTHLHTMGLGDRIDPTVQWHMLATLDRHGLLPSSPPLQAWVEAHVDEAPRGQGSALRLRVAEQRMHHGDLTGMQRAMGTDAAARPFLPLLTALLSAQQGQWDVAVEAFPQAWKDLCSHLGKRRGIAPQSVLQLYPLALMAQHDAQSWTAARKFCVAMSGSRTPSPRDDWGLWAHALAVRLGDEKWSANVFDPDPWRDGDPLRDPDRQADKLVLAAWLDRAPKVWPVPLRQALAAALTHVGLRWKAALVDQACERMGWSTANGPADLVPTGQPFFAPRRDAWRDALAAITALGAGAAGTVEQPLTTLRWCLTLDGAGRVLDLEAFEMPASGRGKPKRLSLAQLKKQTRLDPRDAAVARCLRTARWRASDMSLDLVAAASALVGHPGLELADVPGVLVELQETLPVLEVTRERQDPALEHEHFVFQLQDALIAADAPRLTHHTNNDTDHDAESDRRNSLRIVRDAPDRARLLRITPAHKRVAELIAQRWTVPVDAGTELTAAMRVLAGHFVLHSDVQAGEPVPSDARLVAQLQPRGDALRLTLAVRPFGDFGPLLPPHQGRARQLTMHGGVSLTTERDLNAERTHLAAVLEALPFLADSSDAAQPGQWQLDEPEQSLAAVDALGRLAGETTHLRALEWPKGQALRVLAPEAKAFATKLRSDRDWFALDGSLQIDATRVLSLKQLLGLMHEGRSSRYVALGNGEYLALADQLRQRLAELAAIGELDASGAVKLGATAAVWLADAADDLGVRGDLDWRKRAAQLSAAATLDAAVPHGLQAALRPYQHDGMVWMLRLAHAGFGAILADDMGLGKTVQTLAVLLARAGDGPALVVAPTSVCSNWADETARFAPALRCDVYGQGEDSRVAQLEAAVAGRVLIVSYALLQRDAELFAARGPWATLVLDEAQALKNAATQRVQAVATLQAGFKLALSGTPVENRLADLWSIMHLVNPGLLGSANRFSDRFGNPIERQGDDGARSRLRRLVGPFLLRRTKAQVLTDLPPRTEVIQRVEPQAEERAFLEALRQQALERIAKLDPDDQKNRFNVLAELTRLRRAACDPRLAAPELGWVGAKVQAFERLATELVAGRHQALVFSQFTDFLKLLAERLDAAGLRYQYLDGSTPAAARGERVAAFQRGEADLFLISLKAGGFGLNLTAADYVVITDPWWNPAAEDQAMGRAHRIGQQRPVTVYRLVTAGSIEERIVQMHHGKRDLAEGLLAGQDSGAALAPDALMDLLKA
jgi:superfamily II DNA or RNA helicase